MLGACGSKANRDLYVIITTMTLLMWSHLNSIPLTTSHGGPRIYLTEVNLGLNTYRAHHLLMKVLILGLLEFERGWCNRVFRYEQV